MRFMEFLNMAGLALFFAGWAFVRGSIEAGVLAALCAAVAGLILRAVLRGEDWP